MSDNLSVSVHVYPCGTYICASVSTYVIIFSQDLFIIFSEILHSDRKLETAKSDRSKFSKKSFICLKVDNKDPKFAQDRVFLIFEIFLSLHIARSSLK